MIITWRHYWNCSKFRARFIIFADLWWRNIIQDKLLGVSVIFWILSFPRNKKCWIYLIIYLIPMSSCMDWYNEIYSASMFIRSIWDFHLETQVKGHTMKVMIKPVCYLTQRGFDLLQRPRYRQGMSQCNILPVGSERVQELKIYLLCL